MVCGTVRRPSRTMVALLNLLHEIYGFEWPASLGQPAPTASC